MLSDLPLLALDQETLNIFIEALVYKQYDPHCRNKDDYARVLDLLLQLSEDMQVEASLDLATEQYVRENGEP